MSAILTRRSALLGAAAATLLARHAGAFEQSVSNLEKTLDPYDFRFFASIHSSGVRRGFPYVRRYAGEVLFGYSDDPGYYGPIFAKFPKEFAALNVVPQAYPAAFDGLISFHYENAVPILKSNYLPWGGVVADIGCRGCHFGVKVGKIASKVICIDPTDLSEKFFDLHTTENGLKNCVFHKTAVGEKEELRKFYSGSSGETYSGFWKAPSMTPTAPAS